MRFILSILLIILLSAVAEYFLPWWSLAIVAFLIAFLLKMHTGKALLAGFVSIALLWFVWALCFDIPNHHILSDRMAKLFSLPNHLLFLLVTVVIGGLVGALSAWSGAVLRKIFA